ncbi:hypothetical protein R5R35_000573 [Gryllus longicercus]|uniref:Cytochrome P450 n=1 Tax=Gryllus longicercus TaxID=2509291 RepID=A0AAN9VBE6_9ORTH
MSDAEHVEAIFRSSVNIDKAFTYKFLEPWLGKGLLTSSGKKWHSHRKLITPTFHFKILEAFQEVFAEKSSILVQKLEKEVGNTEGFDVYPYITLCALDIICETAMGTEINAQEDSHSPYVSAIYRASELTLGRMLRPWLHSDFIYSLTRDGKKYKQCLNTLHSFTSKVINERKLSLMKKHYIEEEPDVLGKKRRKAFLDLLLEASEEGGRLTDEEIREEVDTFMFEGHDTTSASLCWTLFLLGNYPQIQERVFEEQSEIFNGSDRLPTTQDVAEMKYLERVIKESLRLYPSVPFIGRALTEEVQVGEYLLPADTHVNIQIYHVNRDPKYFPNPDEFNPDNFLPEKVQGRHPYAYVPFSAGSRNCIGQKFALLEEKTVLSAVIRRFRVRALDRPADITLVAELVLRPLNGIRLVLERR